jgi:hypothetical protein
MQLTSPPDGALVIAVNKLQGVPAEQVPPAPAGDAYFWFVICARAGDDNETTAASVASKQTNGNLVMEHSSCEIVKPQGNVIEFRAANGRENTAPASRPLNICENLADDRLFPGTGPVPIGRCTRGSAVHFHPAAHRAGLPTVEVKSGSGRSGRGWVRHRMSASGPQRGHCRDRRRRPLLSVAV